ncbi:MAG: hypothetical protein J6P21_00395 [Clostridia bacterium]|nr:hypothetical protein [Clostridia bacterium]
MAAKLNFFDKIIKKTLNSIGCKNCKVNITYALETQAKIIFDKKIIKSNFTRTIIWPSKKILI